MRRNYIERHGRVSGSRSTIPARFRPTVNATRWRPKWSGSISVLWGLPAVPRTPPITPAGTVEIFFSYSHKDAKHRDALAAHLSQLKNEGKIREWYDRKIGAGAEWKSQITDHLDSAHIILLLI